MYNTHIKERLDLMVIGLAIIQVDVNKSINVEGLLKVDEDCY